MVPSIHLIYPINMRIAEKIYSGLNKSLLFIEHYWRQILVIIILIVLVFSIKKCYKEKSLDNDLKKVQLFNDSTYTSQLKIWKDKYNEEHTRAENLVVSNTAMKVATDSIVKLLKIKSKQIISVSKTGTSLAVEIPIIIDTVRDTIPCPASGFAVVKKDTAFHYSDKWISIQGILKGKSSTATITGIDTLTRVDYSKRKWFLGKKHYYSDFSNKNPYITVTGYKGLETKATKKKFSLGIGLQIGYPIDDIKNLNKPVVQVGIGLQYSLFGF